MKNLMEKILKQCEEGEAEMARKYKRNACLMPCVKNKDEGLIKVKEEFKMSNLFDFVWCNLVEVMIMVFVVAFLGGVVAGVCLMNMFRGVM